MARIRGAMHRPVGGASKRRRPTTSVHRERAGVRVPEDLPIEEPHMHTDVTTTEDVGTECFPGSPEDCSVLTNYTDHVAIKVWAGEEHAELKLASHGRKVTKFGKPAAEIEGLMVATGLSPLIHCSVETGDRGLLSAFVERWHAKTSSFHPPVGELTIMLDDVASFLHIPVMGVFHSYDQIEVGKAITLLVELLEVTVDEAEAETTQCHGAYARFSWLQELYFRMCDSRCWA